MARPKEFDRPTALQQAIQVFRDHGYEGSSTAALLEAMGISRQSLYDTFGDKRKLYLEALQRYNADSVSSLIQTMQGGASPLAGIQAMLVAFATRPASEASLGCLGVSAVCEFGRSDPEVSALTDTSSRALSAAFERQVAAAKQAGEVGGDIEPADAARFLAATLAGMKVSARDGASETILQNIASLAIRSLR